MLTNTKKIEFFSMNINFGIFYVVVKLSMNKKWHKRKMKNFHFYRIKIHCDNLLVELHLQFLYYFYFFEAFSLYFLCVFKCAKATNFYYYIFKKLKALNHLFRLVKL